jgi:hypothetical protein
MPVGPAADSGTMRRFNTPPAFTIIPADDAVRLTGRAPAELQTLPQVQILTRMLANGSRVTALRLPTELLAAAETASAST